MKTQKNATHDEIITNKVKSAHAGKNNATVGPAQAEEDGGNPALNPLVMKRLKQFRKIVAIVSNETNVDFLMADDHKYTERQIFKELKPHLRPDCFLQIQDFKFINIRFMADENHIKDPWWIKLPNGITYNVSPFFKPLFQHNLHNMLKYKRIRLQREEKRHKSKFSSKYDQYI